MVNPTLLKTDSYQKLILDDALQQQTWIYALLPVIPPVRPAELLGYLIRAINLLPMQ